MLVAYVEFNDGEKTSEIRGYQETIYEKAGVVQFVWDNELLTIPIHRISSILETFEDEV